MTDIEYIAETLSEEDILCQIAEEAAELAQAALKLRRVITQTNPTPVTVDEAKYNLLEEYGDVCGAFWVYAVKNKAEDDISEVTSDNISAKYNRWAQQIKEGKNREKRNDQH